MVTGQYILFLSYAAATLGVIATLLLAEKRKAGWVVSIASILMFITYGLIEGIGSFVIVEIVGIFTSMYALDRWLTPKKHRKFERTIDRKIVRRL